MRERIRGILRSVGRASGLAGGLTALALWLMFVVANGVNWVTGAMTVLAVTAVAAAWVDRPALLLMVALASFVPVGLYLLRTPSIYAGIGLSNLLCITGAALLLAARRDHRDHPSA